MVITEPDRYVGGIGWDSVGANVVGFWCWTDPDACAWGRARPQRLAAAHVEMKATAYN